MKQKHHTVFFMIGNLHKHPKTKTLFCTIIYTV